MTVLIHFLLGFALSFIGSLPLGIINLSVAEAAIKRGLRLALIMATGASIVEILQAWATLSFTQLFADNPDLDHWIRILSIPIFLILAAYYFFQKPKPPHLKESKSKRNAFFKGTAVAMLNFLAFPYWLFYSAYLSSRGWLSFDPFLVFTFALGVGLGVWVLLWGYAKLAMRIVNKLEKVAEITGRIIAAVFLILGLWQLVSLWMKGELYV